MAVRRSAIPVSVELADSAVYLWEFLQMVDSYPWLYDGLHVHNAVRRYEKFWLPLAAQVGPDYLMSPPLDIQWVWYVHMLSPYAYHRDCLHRFGKVVHHRILSAKDRNIGLNFARELWEKSYKNEKFSLDLAAPPKMSGTFTSKFSYDLFTAISRQRFFNYQVALKHYRDSKFLERAVKRYKDFLCAKLNEPSLVLSGCFDVQLIWHVHMAHPMMYRDDTRKVFGEMLGHYDTEVGSGTVTWTASPARQQNTSAPKPLPGAMCRGEALVCTTEKILLTRKQKELTFKIKLLKEEFQHTVTMATARSRDLVLTPCWFELPSLTLDCSSHVLNLTNGKSDKVYNVRVTHSVAPILSTVEIVHPKEFLIATAHTIAGKQIPMKSQLAELQRNCCVYDPEARERAMLIRSQKDWGICVGKWVGAQDTGELIITFFDMESNSWINVAQSSTQNAETTIYELKLFGHENPVFINLETGLVTVPCDDVATFIPEIIALTYSIGILYSLCRERTREFYPVEPFVMLEQKGLQPCQLGKQIKALRTTKRDGVFGTGSMGKKVLWLNRDPFVSNLLLATGRNCPWTPSNSFLRFFHENVLKVFGQCVLSSDERSSVEALHEVEYVLEYLGVKESVKKSPKTPTKAKKASSPSKERQKAAENGQSLKDAKDRFSNMQLDDVNELTDDGGSERKAEVGSKKKGKKKTKRSVVDEEHDERRSEGDNGSEGETGEEGIGRGRREEERGEDDTDGWKGKSRDGGDRREREDGRRVVERREGKRVGWHDEIRDEWEEGRKGGKWDEREDDSRGGRGSGWDNERRDDRRSGEWDQKRRGWDDERKDDRRNGWDEKPRGGRDEWDEGRRNGGRGEWHERNEEGRRGGWNDERLDDRRRGFDEERREEKRSRWDDERSERRRDGWEEKGYGGSGREREDGPHERRPDLERRDDRRDGREDKEHGGMKGWREDRIDGRRDWEERRDGRDWEGKRSRGERSGWEDERRHDMRDRWGDERREGRRDDFRSGWDEERRSDRRSEWDGSQDEGGYNKRSGWEEMRRYDRKDGRDEQGRYDSRNEWEMRRRSDNRDGWKQDRREEWRREEPRTQTARRDSDQESYFV